MLTGWGAEVYLWAALTVVSELATNAVLHARTPFTVALELGADSLRVEVSDRSLRRPQPRAYGEDATTGRGLALLEALAGATGVEVTDGGKTGWCELTAQTAGRSWRVDSVDPAESHDGAAPTAVLPDARPGEDPARQAPPEPAAPAETRHSTGSSVTNQDDSARAA